MDLNEYQLKASRTINPALSPRDRILNGAIGLSGETGEVNDLIKKFIFHDHDLPVKDFINELGDVLWYLAELTTAIGVDLEEVAQKNIDKLKERYPDGFTVSRSYHD